MAIDGLPLAQQAFGQQMFVQMAVFAPFAGLLIFALMWFFFRRLGLVVPAMLLSMLTVIWTMGLLTGTGNTLHIMSSMLPILLMPIAILDSSTVGQGPSAIVEVNALPSLQDSSTLPASSILRGLGHGVHRSRPRRWSAGSRSPRGGCQSGCHPSRTFGPMPGLNRE